MLPTPIQRSTLVSRKPTLKLLVIPCESLMLAIHIDSIQKIMKMPEIYRSGQKAIGLAHFENREAIVIDLHQKLYSHPNSKLAKYLIVIESTDERLFGIPVPTLPTLINVLETELKELPPDYREQDTLGIASHLVTIAEGNQAQMIFLLDPGRVFASFNSDFSPLF